MKELIQFFKEVFTKFTVNFDPRKFVGAVAIAVIDLFGDPCLRWFARMLILLSIVSLLCSRFMELLGPETDFFVLVRCLGLNLQCFASISRFL
jgi:hypothetical protein